MRTSGGRRCVEHTHSARRSSLRSSRHAVARQQCPWSGHLGSGALQGLVEAEGFVAVSGAGFAQDTPLRTQGRQQLLVLREELAEQVTDELVPPLPRVGGGEGLGEWQGKGLLRHTR